MEQPGVGDYYRALLKGKSLLDQGHLDAIYKGKKSLGLDLKSREGREIFLRLVRRSDVVIENFRPGILKKLRVSYPFLKKVNRRVILCSITGLGQKGSEAHLAGHDLSYLGMSGLLTKIRDREGRMVVPGFQLIDLAAGQDAAMRICAALVGVRGTKKGCWIDSSMIQSGTSYARLYPQRETNRPASGARSAISGGLLRYGIYETGDGRHVTLAALEPKFWIKFCRLISRPEWASDAEDYEYLGDERLEELKEIFRSKGASEWVDLGRREDICLFPVTPIGELQLPPARKAPRLGAHTTAILRSLGFSSARIADFKKKGVVTISEAGV